MVRDVQFPAFRAALSGILCLACVSCRSLLPGRGVPTLTALPRTIVVDGKLDDWEGVAFVTVTPRSGVFETEGTSSNADSAADLSYRFAVCRDSDALYVAVQVTDDVRVVDSTQPGETAARAWEDDAVEVFIDGNFNRAPDARDKERREYQYGGEFSLVTNGAATTNCTAWPDSFGKPDHWQGAVSHRQEADGGFTLFYEYRLLWKVMGGNVRPGDTIGFTIGVQDDDDGERRDHALYWQGTSPHCWRNEAGWGAVRLTP